MGEDSNQVLRGRLQGHKHTWCKYDVLEADSSNIGLGKELIPGRGTEGDGPAEAGK